MSLIQRQVEDAKAVQTLWMTLLPKCPAPEMERIVLWVVSFEEVFIRHGIRRTAAKFYRLRGPMTAEQAHRYATSVMAHERENQKGWTA
jgi:hypothetical protein